MGGMGKMGGMCKMGVANYAANLAQQAQPDPAAEAQEAQAEADDAADLANQALDEALDAENLAAQAQQDAVPQAAGVAPVGIAPPPPDLNPGVQDEAEAVGDPHMKLSNGKNADLCCKGNICRACPLESLLQHGGHAGQPGGAVADAAAAADAAQDAEAGAR